MTDRLVCSHAQFEQQHPADREYAQDLERARLARYRRVHGSEAGYVPGRELPCRGMLRAFDESGPQVLVRCDVCGWETSGRRERRPATAPAPDFEAPF